MIGFTFPIRYLPRNQGHRLAGWIENSPQGKAGAVPTDRGDSQRTTLRIPQTYGSQIGKVGLKLRVRISSCMYPAPCFYLFLWFPTFLLLSRCSSVNDKPCFVPRLTNVSNVSDVAASLQNGTDISGANYTGRGIHSVFFLVSVFLTSRIKYWVPYSYICRG